MRRKPELRKPELRKPELRKRTLQIQICLECRVINKEHSGALRKECKEEVQKVFIEVKTKGQVFFTVFAGLTTSGSDFQRVGVAIGKHLGPI